MPVLLRLNEAHGICRSTLEIITGPGWLSLGEHSDKSGWQLLTVFRVTKCPEVKNSAVCAAARLALGAEVQGERISLRKEQ